MRTEELPLYEAIHDAWAEIEDTKGETPPASDQWLIDPVKSKKLCQMIVVRLPIPSPFTQPEMISAWVRYRKSAKDKLSLLINVARCHGRQCFYKYRGLGDCSDDLTVDRIIPEARGGIYAIWNCVIACSRHNSGRGQRSIEKYIENYELPPPGNGRAASDTSADNPDGPTADRVTAPVVAPVADL